MPALLAILLTAAPGHAGLKFVAKRGPSTPTLSLDDVEAVAVSPGAGPGHLYAAVRDENAVVVLARDPSSGALSLVEVQTDGVAGADGLSGADGIAVSPDGANVYVAGGGEDALAVFARNPLSGSLSFVEVKRDGVGGVDGLAGARSVVVSGDGKHVYITSSSENAVAVFTRNAVTGALTYVEKQQDGVGGVDGLDFPIGLALSPGGEHLYVAGFSDGAVAVFSRDSATGALTFVETEFNGIGGVQGLWGADAVAVSGDGKNVYVTGFNSYALAVFSRDTVTGALTFVTYYEDGSGGISGLEEPFSVLCSPDGRSVYVGGVGLAIFSRAPNTGSLTFVQSELGYELGQCSLATSPDGRELYSACFDSILHYGRNTVAGSLRYLDGVTDSGVAPNLDGASGIAFGGGAYVSARDGNALSAFRVGSESGLLVGVAKFVDGVGGANGLAGAEDVATDLSGYEVFVAGAQDFALSRYSYYNALPSDVEFDGIGGADGLYEARSLVVSPDGAHVYVVGRSDGKIGVYRTNGPLAAFSFVEVQTQGVGGVDGLNLPYEIAISPDGKHLYVTSYENSSIAVFERDSITGSLTFVEVLEDGVGGVDGLFGAIGVTVSPDGAHVYTTSSGDLAVGIFARHPFSGALTFVGTTQGGYPVSFPTGGPIEVSPDGNYVYTVGSSPGLLLFRRDSSTGLLTMAMEATDDDNAMPALSLPSDIGIDAEGKYVYVTDSGDDAVVIFRQSCGDGTLDASEQCDDGNQVSGDCCSSTCQFESSTCSTILGKALIIKDPKPGIDATKRTIVVRGIEPFSPDVLVGNPVATGATLEIAANGDGAMRQTISLPAGANWHTTASGFKYADPAGTNGPVKLLLVGRSVNSTFVIKVKLMATVNPIAVVPPNVGTDGGLKLTIPAGGTYCVRLGGPAGGAIPGKGNSAKIFKVVSSATSPATESGCP